MANFTTAESYMLKLLETATKGNVRAAIIKSMMAKIEEEYKNKPDDVKLANKIKLLQLVEHVTKPVKQEPVVNPFEDGGRRFR